MSRRITNRRGIKKHSLLPSFGDIVLPIVGVAALGLLILAGRQFFVNGMKPSPSITSTRAYADSPALMAERERSSLPPAAKTPEPSADIMAEDKAARENTVLAVADNSAAPAISEVKPAVSQAPKAQTPSPAKKPEAPSKPAPLKASKLPESKQWRVQTGAYTSKSGAEEAVKKIKRAGFKAKVYQNPASKHFKVWVVAGESKYQAGLVVDAMKKLGYKSAFSFPPMKQ
ncbi:MAG: SPOR domain-containing protein [Synergistaceae bacterium]|nr:SPOR domain-containing protein [Synergistaceae bacterium]